MKQQDLNELIRFRMEPELSQVLHAQAARLRVKPTELARIALSLGLDALQVGSQPATAGGANDAKS